MKPQTHSQPPMKSKSPTLTTAATAGLLLLATAASSLITSCVDPMMPPPPPPGRGRNLDAPPRYGVSESQTRYFEGTPPPPPGSGDPAAVLTPEPGAPPVTTVVPPPVTTVVPPPVTTVVPPPTTTPAPTPAPAPAADIPFATRMPGKPGFVKSPFDPNGQAIDVRDFQSGQKARCPYTGKIFKVP